MAPENKMVKFELRDSHSEGNQTLYLLPWTLYHLKWHSKISITETLLLDHYYQIQGWSGTLKFRLLKLDMKRRFEKKKAEVAL